ncbi:MAG: hypothetical protein M2R45_05140 [Verrucomicrobia subdivision 3 bacterium]|nr:hypothetical protein [Limisphaerales bacterium]MCS1417202.1 hypothetical protein [Limisphaerales bacterium]
MKRNGNRKLGSFAPCYSASSFLRPICRFHRAKPRSMIVRPPHHVTRYLRMSTASRTILVSDQKASVGLASEKCRISETSLFYSSYRANRPQPLLDDHVRCESGSLPYNPQICSCREAPVQSRLRRPAVGRSDGHVLGIRNRHHFFSEFARSNRLSLWRMAHFKLAHPDCR